MRACPLHLSCVEMNPVDVPVGVPCNLPAMHVSVRQNQTLQYCKQTPMEQHLGNGRVFCTPSQAAYHEFWFLRRGLGFSEVSSPVSFTQAATPLSPSKDSQTWPWTSVMVFSFALSPPSAFTLHRSINQSRPRRCAQRRKRTNFQPAYPLSPGCFLAGVSACMLAPDLEKDEDKRPDSIPCLLLPLLPLLSELLLTLLSRLKLIRIASLTELCALLIPPVTSDLCGQKEIIYPRGGFLRLLYQRL